MKRKNQPALLSAAAESVVSQLKLLAGDPLTAQDQAAQKQITRYNRSHAALAIGLAAAGVAAGLALFFIFRQKAQNDQAAFCVAHNISPCPGA